MSILNQLASGQGEVMESIEPVVVSESDMAALLTAALEDACSDEELEELSESVNTGGVTLTPVEERSIVKLDKKAKKQKLYRLALYQVAKDANDPFYEKLVTCWEAERMLEDRIEKKYHVKAVARMKEMIKASKDSKHPKIKKAHDKADKLTKSQKQTQRALSGTNKLNQATINKTKAIANKLRPS